MSKFAFSIAMLAVAYAEGFDSFPVLETMSLMNDENQVLSDIRPFSGTVKRDIRPF